MDPETSPPAPRMSSPEAEALIGTVLAGTYRIKSAVVFGGAGQLYEAEHLRIERRLAVKVIHAWSAQLPQARQRMEREARVTGRIRSPHVVPIVDFVRTADGRPCLITEFLEGEDLRTRLERVQKLPVAKAIAIARQICKGLAAAHKEDVVHRDLKPANIFLTPREDGTDHVRILDFGVAKFYESSDDVKLTAAGATVGTPQYMPPEQATGASEVTLRADLYAVGAILYHMLSGQPPYGAEDTTNLLIRLLSSEPPALRTIDDSIPEPVANVVQKAMAREPADRPGSAEELDRMLAQCRPSKAREDSSALDTVGPSDAPQSLAERPRLTRTVALFVVLLTSALVGTWLAALLSAIVNQSTPLDSIQGIGRFALIAAPIVVSLGVAALLVKLLSARWKDSARLARWSTTLMRGLLAGLVVAAALELVQRSLQGLPFAWQPLTRYDDAWRLGIAAVVTAAALLLGSLQGTTRAN